MSLILSRVLDTVSSYAIVVLGLALGGATAAVGV